MKLTFRHLKRIIKEAVNEKPRSKPRSKPPSREAQIVRFIEDLHFQFGHTFGDEGGEMPWDEVMDFAREKGVRTTPDEIERVFLNSPLLDGGLGYIMHVTNSGFFFDDPMAL
jgi:hypothetical protein